MLLLCTGLPSFRIIIVTSKTHGGNTCIFPQTFCSFQQYQRHLLHFFCHFGFTLVGRPQRRNSSTVANCDHSIPVLLQSFPFESRYLARLIERFLASYGLCSCIEINCRSIYAHALCSSIILFKLSRAFQQCTAGVCMEEK